MTTVSVRTGKPYDIMIRHGLMDGAGRALLALTGKPCHVAILTDDTVDALFGTRVQTSLEESGFRVCKHAMPHGEEHKTAETWLDMLTFLAQNRLTRADYVLALGGGVPGDVAGFAAASYLRGVPFVQMPTTLLAMVDSSVGGKTGFDLPQGKNLAGAFHQPAAVLCDPAALATLPRQTLLDGVAEALKHGVLGDAALFYTLSSGQWLASPTDGLMESVIARNVSIKADLVASDEHDTGRRQMLNLGHTFGHAVEKRSGYTVSHGQAVAMGMLCAARLADRLGMCGADTVQAIRQALARNGLPTAVPYPAQELVDAALSDKKRQGDTLTLVLPTDVGSCALYPTNVAALPKLWRMAMEGEEQ